MPAKPKANREPETSVYETEKFRKLEDIWNKKLAASGFEDIETGREPNKFLKQWDATWFVNRRHGWRGTLERQIYYQECDRFLQEHPFKSRLDRRIWAMHADGKTLAETSRSCARWCKPSYVSKVVSECKAILLRELKNGPSNN